MCISDGALTLSAPDGGDVRQLRDANDLAVSAVEWAPDASRFAYFVRTADQQLELHVLLLDSLQDRTLLRAHHSSEALRKVAWSADGAYLAWAPPSQGLVLAAADGRHLVTFPADVEDYVW